MNTFIYLCRQIWNRQSVTRAFLNLKLQEVELRGKTIDIGGGKNAEYISFLKRDTDTSLETFDMKNGQEDIDFEKDSLPANDGTYDTVLFLNVMEHIFNYQHIANEVVRITKKDGQLIGFVPFLMWYHPDHSDFFRYTHEALEIIFKNAGAERVEIEPISKGPFIAACQMIIQSLPRIIRVPVFSLFYALDVIFLKLRSTHGERYALGYYFVANNT